MGGHLCRKQTNPREGPYRYWLCRVPQLNEAAAAQAMTERPTDQHNLWASLVAQTVKNLQCRRPGFIPWVRKIPWRREWLSTPVFLPREFCEQRSPAGWRPWGSQRIRHVWATNTLLCIYTEPFILFPWRRKWQPTSVFLPGKSQGQEPGGLQPTGLQRIGHYWALTHFMLYMPGLGQRPPGSWGKTLRRKWDAETVRKRKLG